MPVFGPLVRTSDSHCAAPLNVSSGQGNHKMNTRYFACKTCHNYIDAGYRHCYWTLEAPGIVERNKPVNVPAVLEAADYWRGADGVEFVDSLDIRPFLQQHQEHDLVFAEDEDIGLCPMFKGDYRVFEWMDEGESSPVLSPRFFVERLGMQTWAQVREYVEKETSLPGGGMKLSICQEPRRSSYCCLHPG